MLLPYKTVKHCAFILEVFWVSFFNLCMYNILMECMITIWPPATAQHSVIEYRVCVTTVIIILCLKTLICLYLTKYIQCTCKTISCQAIINKVNRVYIHVAITKYPVHGKDYVHVVMNISSTVLPDPHYDLHRLSLQLSGVQWEVTVQQCCSMANIDIVTLISIHFIISSSVNVHQIAQQ